MYIPMYIPRYAATCLVEHNWWIRVKLDMRILAILECKYCSKKQHHH